VSGKLKLAPGLALAPEAALQRFGILAMSGAGKSNAAVVLAEEMYDAGIPWVAIDPKGDWWGIRSSADGKRDGLLVPVFGGLRGDVPLEETAGKLLAELVAERRLTCVLDISEMSKGAQLRFLTDFAETLLRKNRAPLQVIAEEADEYLPQRVMKREAPCVGAWAKLVKRGRFRGVFVTLVTQRSAALSKDALSQIDTLIPMRVGDPRDKRALKDWVVEHDVGQEMFDSLPRLEDGEAWIWSPHKLKLMERIRFRRRRTFDSGATPDWKERAPARLADVDLDAVRDEMAETIERAKAQDPKELRRRIARLEKDLRSRPTEKETIEVEKTVEVPVLANGAVDRLDAAVEAIRSAGEQLHSAAGEIAGELARIGAKKPGAPAPRAPQKVAQRQRQPVASTPVANEEGEVRLKAGARRMLASLAMLHPTPLTRVQVATLSDIAPKSGTFSDYLSTLKRAGLVDEQSGKLELTDRGHEEMADQVGVGAPSPEELSAMWGRKLKAGARRMLDALMASHPDGLTRAELAEASEITAGSGTFSDYLSSLRRNALAEEHGGEVFAGEALFLGAMAR
jgi:uncharacterized protein